MSFPVHEFLFDWNDTRPDTFSSLPLSMADKVLTNHSNLLFDSARC